jgi:hypothetical protein
MIIKGDKLDKAYEKKMDRRSQLINWLNSLSNKKMSSFLQEDLLQLDKYSLEELGRIMDKIKEV